MQPRGWNGRDPLRVVPRWWQATRSVRDLEAKNLQKDPMAFYLRIHPRATTHRVSLVSFW